MTDVSVRELKNNLSDYLRRAEAGEEIAITRRGKRVARLSTAAGEAKPRTLHEKMLDLQARGIISNYTGKKFVPTGKPIKLRGEGPTMSEMIIEDRR